ncbi:hypothetical protein DFQ28_011389 [Apophysomyces sp. BC1034]|nr:hypothetical protein DFQ30_004122 [Apophysomyces sp. BC1015]KAG0174139.1 hypothetical protein DFQ29_007593 [Apophysomyces sp. BC1021]KAG0191629.1 hypothetical protein DFQ28_011389 [Apophysomyces sp. BC1034]
MNGFRTALRKLPPSTTVKILRKVFSLPAPAARLILNDVTRPRKSHRTWIHKVPWNKEWSGCWIGENVSKLDATALQQRIDQADIVFFNVHGGGFRIGSCTMYMDSYIGWLRLLKEKYGLTAIIMSVDYRLAPEYKYPSPVEDIVRAYEYLVKTLAVDGSRIIALGDSNGASLVLEMLFITHDPSMFEIVTDEGEQPEQLAELPRPAGTVLISPLVTDETTSESWKVNVKHDYISLYTARVIKRDYFEPPEQDSPDSNQVLGIAKLQTGFQAFLSSHVLMFVGNKEVLRDDALDLAAKAEEDGVQWKTIVEDSVHNWFCVREVVKDSSILERGDQTFAEFCYRTVISQRQSTVGSLRPPSDGLEAVPEDAEDEDDEEFHEALTETDLDSTSTTAYEKLPGNEKAVKQKPLTVYV